MRAHLLIPALATLAIGGCGGSSERSARDVAGLQPCPPSAWADGGGTDWEVSGGVTCEEVGEFVFHRFEPHPGPSVQRSGGFTCRVEQPGGEYQALRVECAAADRRRFRFVFH